MIELTADPARFDARVGELLASTVLNTVPATILHGIRNGVYLGDTPPRFAIVADASGTVTGAALRTPPLFTDLANPISNRIYADVGYRRIADYEQHALISSDPR